MGIYLYNPAGADSFSANMFDADHDSSRSVNVGHQFTYTVDVSPGESVVISGDFGDDSVSSEGTSFVFTPTSSFLGTLVGNADGTFTYSFTRAEVDAAGGNQGVGFFVTGNDIIGNSDTDLVIVSITCFAKGTQIATPTGECAVEALAMGDLVRTADGWDVPVKWVGRQSLMPATLGARSEPVRISAGALGENTPHTDLTVTADHGMVLDGYVVNASALVGLSGIDWVRSRELAPRFTVYHVETEQHDVILANGAPAETFCDTAGRQVFDNYGEYLALFGAEPIIPEMPKPRICSRRLLPTDIQRRLGTSGTASEVDTQSVA